MNILILQPVDEQHSLNSLMLATAIGMDVALPMAAYADWLLKTHNAKSWEEAIIMTNISAIEFMKMSGHRVLIGNISKDFKNNFELVVSYNDGIDNSPYKDRMRDILVIKTNNEPTIKKYFNNQYSSGDSKLEMINVEATSDFIKAYLKSEVKKNDIIEQYKNRIDLFRLR